MKLNTRRLRCMLGWLGILLPWIVTALVRYFPTSISATWHTNACTVFMIVLGSASLLLISYKGYELVDDLLLTFSGVFGLMVCIFPCNVPNAPERFGTFMLPGNVSDIIHSISAILLFLLLAVNSFFLFTKTDDKENMTKKKKIRNIIYRVCGIGMIAVYLMFLLPDFYIKVWLIETIALFFFGVSWLTKANCYKFLFCD